MLQQLPHKPHGLPKAKTLSRDGHERAEEMLRDLAFVLKMTQEVRRIYSEKFGLRILEGYGATECSPVISANTISIHYGKHNKAYIDNVLKMTKDGDLAGKLLARTLVQRLQTGAVTNVTIPAELVVRESA